MVGSRQFVHPNDREDSRIVLGEHLAMRLVQREMSCGIVIVTEAETMIEVGLID